MNFGFAFVPECASAAPTQNSLLIIQHIVELAGGSSRGKIAACCDLFVANKKGEETPIPTNACP